jgi:hypothetical protein
MNSSRCSPTSFLRKTHLTPPRWRNKHATSPSFSRPFPIQSAAASSQTFRGRGNVTGFTNIEPTTAGKWLELLKEIAPHVARVAFLFNPATAPYEYYLSSFKAAARSFAVEAIAAPVRDRSELEPVITALARAPNGGLVLMTDTFLLNHRRENTAQLNASCWSRGSISVAGALDAAASLRSSDSL